MYVVVAQWVAKVGEEQTVERLLLMNAEASRAEPGCRGFLVHRSLEDPRAFLLYEEYDDEAAFDVHRETEHFKKYVLGDALDRLDSRQFAPYEVLG